MLRIRQIVFVVRDLAARSRQLAELLALDPPYRDPGVAEFGIDNAVFAFGDQFIELISPLADGTAAGRHLERRGEGGYMLILQTDAFDRDRARIRGLGVRTVWEKELPDIRAMHLHPKDIGGAIVSIDQPVPAASWRWGGPWRRQEGRRGDQRVVAVGVEAPRPRETAERWAQVLGPDAVLPEGGQRIGLTQGAIGFVPAAARGAGLAGWTWEVADLASVRRAARDQGLAVEGDRIALFGADVTLMQR
jgi:hypothetical protein